MFYPHYRELDFAVKIVKRETGEDTRYVPDLPDVPLGLVLVFCGGINYYAYPLPPETLGLDCLCHVVYHAKDDAVMSVWPGKLGQGNIICKLAAYKTIVGKTVGEVKVAEEKARLTAEAEAKGEVVKQADLDAVKYDLKDHEDANDGIPLWIFNTKEYSDK